MTNKQDSLLTLIKTRHSGYLYDSNKLVNQADIITLIEAARFSPSCFCDEPWRYIVCNKQINQNSWEKLLNCLNKSNQKWAKNAQVLIISLSAKNFQKINKGKNSWAKHDTGAANYALMLQATSMNLMAHQMSGFNKNKIIEKFNIPNNFNIMSVISIGYEEEGVDIKKKIRKPIEEVLFYDEWPK
ncbi:MAG: nitroreductase family protein [Wolbachia endosymbiont of Menacanthus eurysternus]|nr:MAG: nitroreductase family protein [Wolbachia endosymbiont of Menacanthus eurysternus]